MKMMKITVKNKYTLKIISLSLKMMKISVKHQSTLQIITLTQKIMKIHPMEYKSIP